MGPNYCGPRSLRPNSENLVNKIKVHNTILSQPTSGNKAQVIVFIFFFFFFFFFNNFPFNRSFEYLYISIIYHYLSSFRQAGVGSKIPWPGQLAPHPWKNG